MKGLILDTSAYAEFKRGEETAIEMMRGSGQALVGTSALADANWHHIVAIRDGITGENRLYFDGILEASSPVSYTDGFDSTTADLNIGSLNDISMNYH